jgi:hypothetical protein
MNEEQLLNELTPFGIIDTGHDMFEEQPLMAVSGDSFLFSGDEI